ncbi:hypothetical protein pb186bvf_007334 [Paramecium bursaria]
MGSIPNCDSSIQIESSIIAGSVTSRVFNEPDKGQIQYSINTRGKPEPLQPINPIKPENDFSLDQIMYEADKLNVQKNKKKSKKKHSRQRQSSHDYQKQRAQSFDIQFQTNYYTFTLSQHDKETDTNHVRSILRNQMLQSGTQRSYNPPKRVHFSQDTKFNTHNHQRSKFVLKNIK